jgi:hypothetical protein
MTVESGCIKTIMPDRGFGFVQVRGADNRLTEEEIFFHFSRFRTVRYDLWRSEPWFGANIPVQDQFRYSEIVFERATQRGKTACVKWAAANVWADAIHQLRTISPCRVVRLVNGKVDEILWETPFWRKGPLNIQELSTRFPRTDTDDLTAAYHESPDGYVGNGLRIEVYRVLPSYQYKGYPPNTPVDGIEPQDWLPAEDIRAPKGVVFQ